MGVGMMNDSSPLVPDAAYIFRELGPDDLDAVLELEYLTFALPWSKEQYMLLMRAGGCRIFGTLLRGRLCAYAAAAMSAKVGELEIYNLAVHPDERRRGLAVRLLSLLLEAASRLGLERAVLEVRAGNKPALELYGKLGFTPCGLRPRYYSDPEEDALLLEYKFKVPE
jgi:ribosomal-protein-alanine N-acetyltransferase